MRRALTALPLLPLLALTPACDSEETDMGDAFRGSVLDVDIQLAQADGKDNDGTILWEVVEAEVYEGLAVEGDLSLFVENDIIYTAAGERTCLIEEPQLGSNVREVIDETGTDVLFTVWDEYVFEGIIDTGITSHSEMMKQFGDQLLFHFDGDEVFLGESSEGFRLLAANADLESSSDGRKLLIAALITGECGASGMPGYNF